MNLFPLLCALHKDLRKVADCDDKKLRKKLARIANSMANILELMPIEIEPVEEHHIERGVQ